MKTRTEENEVLRREVKKYLKVMTAKHDQYMRIGDRRIEVNDRETAQSFFDKASELRIVLEDLDKMLKGEEWDNV